MIIDKNCKQLLIVLSKSWEDTQGKLYCLLYYPDRWQVQLGPFSCSLGEKGMSWGRGLHPLEESKMPLKKEGDNTAPAGVFKIGPLFGSSENPGLDMPYIHLHKDHVWVDDPKSEYYNLLVNKKNIDVKDWDSAEEMVREDGLYGAGCFIHHNAYPTTPFAGSCIFMHKQRYPGSPTAGCTALSEEDLMHVLFYLKDELNPLLIQLPEEEYHKKEIPWGLPSLKKIKNSTL